jgi:ammonia channel protein AmtB
MLKKDLKVEICSFLSGVPVFCGSAGLDSISDRQLLKVTPLPHSHCNSNVATTLGSETLIITMIGATSSAMSWTAIEWSTTGHPSILGMLSGAISGLIALSSGVGYVDQTGSFVIGLVSGAFCFIGSDIRDFLKVNFEDLMGTFTLNFIGGIVGSFLLGFFANNRNGEYHFSNGAFYGNPEQVIFPCSLR